MPLWLPSAIEDDVGSPDGNPGKLFARLSGAAFAQQLCECLSALSVDVAQRTHLDRCDAGFPARSFHIEDQSRIPMDFPLTSFPYIRI